MSPDTSDAPEKAERPQKKAAAGSADEPSLTYEQARDELVSVVHRLESGGVPLDESLRLWERGEELAGICQRWLDGARDRVEAARAARETSDGSQPG